MPPGSQRRNSFISDDLGRIINDIYNPRWGRVAGTSPTLYSGTWSTAATRYSDNDAAMSQAGLVATFLQERPMILRMLAARLGNSDDAEDAAQELWLKLADVAAGSIKNPAAYLFRMAANLASDRRTSAMSGTARDMAWLELQPGVDDLPDAERVLLARERLANIDAVLRFMPERMSTAFRMFRIEGQSQREIAETIGISVSGVEKLLQRAYRQVYDASIFFGEDRAPPHRLGCMKETES